MKIENTQKLTLHHYKEPLIEVPDGFGYYGAVSITMDGDKIQCHICGKLFSALVGHVKGKHGMVLRDYKEKFQLAYKTALISENERQKRKDRTLAWLKTLTDEEKAEWQVRARKGIKNMSAKMKARVGFQPKMSLETKNKRGTCPDQLLDRIQKVADKLGEVPTRKQFISDTGSTRYISLIDKTFGSYIKALKMLKMTPRPRGTTKGQKKVYRYEREELIEYLQIFYQENGKIPTQTDCLRGIIPSYHAYIRVFGSLPKARIEAGITGDPRTIYNSSRQK